MLTKEKILTGIRKLPDSVTMDEVLDHIVLLEKIENGLDQADKGQTFTENDIEIISIHHSAKLLKFD